jgi:hypothetical protein
MQATAQIEFTEDEKLALSRAITKAACGIAECWDLLSQIGARINRDWEPCDTSVSEIADQNASDIENPEAQEPLDPNSVAEFFSDPEHWQPYHCRKCGAPCIRNLVLDTDEDGQWSYCSTECRDRH